jgi:hypothetical protein
MVLNPLKRRFKKKNTWLCKLTFLDVVQIDGHVGVTIRTRVFVPESNGVHQLVHGDTGPVACDAAVFETQLLGASIGRHATISTYAAPAPIVCFLFF